MMQPIWMGGYPVPNASDDIKCYSYSNFLVYYGPGSVVSAPLIKEKQTTVVIKNLPREVTKEMIQELLETEPVNINSSSIVSVDHPVVVSGKASCKVKFDLDLTASLVNTINTWYMRINGIQDEAHESNIIVEYPAPRRYPECNEESIQQLQDDLWNESTFKEALKTLMYWLVQGEVTRANADGFYSLLLSVYNKVNALNNEKMTSDAEQQHAKKDLSKKVETIYLSIKEFKSVLNNASQKKVWDHFTKPQRKLLDAWKEENQKQEEEYSTELLREREEYEMDLDREAAEAPDASSVTALREQLETLQNRRSTLESEQNEYNRKINADIAERQEEVSQKLLEVMEWQEKVEQMEKEVAHLKSEETNSTVETDNRQPAASSNAASEPPRLSGQDIIQLGSLTSFLNLHINGANIEYLTIFLKDSGHSVTPEDVEEMLKRFPNMFTEETVGIGADLRKVWKFVWPGRPTVQSA